MTAFGFGFFRLVVVVLLPLRLVVLGLLLCGLRLVARSQALPPAGPGLRFQSFYS
jgi:hypothetical protein